MRVILFLTFALSLFAQSYSYIQLNANSEYEFRVVDQNDMPQIKCDKLDKNLSLRYEGDYKVWSVNVNECKSVTFNNETIKINKKPLKIAVVGDTGCRIKINKEGYGGLQNCDDNDSWPAAKIADVILSHKPDLVIHVGDYHYREKCNNKELCDEFNISKSDTGYGYNIWKDDFFKPYNNLLKSVPFVFLRGNHEACHRAWQVYKAALSPYEYTQCTQNDNGMQMSLNQTEQPYILNINNIKYAVFDASGDDDNGFVDEDYKTYKLFLDQVKNKSTILLTHIPIYNLNNTDKTSRKKAFIESGFKPKSIFSGDIHLLEHMQNNTTTQVISGGGGSMLYSYKQIPTDFKNAKQFHMFGFTMLEQTKDGYNASFYTFQNKKIYDFKIK